jgi:hypothetical protein
MLPAALGQLPLVGGGLSVGGMAALARARGRARGRARDAREGTYEVPPQAELPRTSTSGHASAASAPAEACGAPAGEFELVLPAMPQLHAELVQVVECLEGIRQRERAVAQAHSSCVIADPEGLDALLERVELGI